MDHCASDFFDTDRTAVCGLKRTKGVVMVTWPRFEKLAAEHKCPACVKAIQTMDDETNPFHKERD